MVQRLKSIGAMALRLMVVLALLSWPRVSSAAGTWSVIPFPGKPGEVSSPAAVTVGPAGDLYVADLSSGGVIQKRDADGTCYENRIHGRVQAHGSPAAPLLSGATGR